MGINPKDFREQIIRPALKILDLWSPAAENLLLGTASVESNLGERLVQNHGPALGVFQIEPNTHEDVWLNYLQARQPLADKVRIIIAPFIHRCPSHDHLIFNLFYSAMIARIIYLRIFEPLPDSNEIVGLAHYWKERYNTHLGKGCVEDFVKRYPKNV